VKREACQLVASLEEFKTMKLLRANLSDGITFTQIERREEPGLQYRWYQESAGAEVGQGSF